VISAFRPEVDENYALLRYYAATSGNFLPTFRNKLSVQSSGVKNPKDTSPPVHLYVGLVPRDYTPALNRCVSELFIVLISFLLYFLPCPSVQIILFLGHPALHAIILSWSSAGLQPLPTLYFMKLFIVIFCIDFYLIVLCSSLLISFLSHSVPALYSTI
jgi:hypothetical protein